MANSSKIIFNDGSISFILRAFNKEVNEDGIIVDCSTKEPILTPEGEQLTLENFGGIKKGSEIFLKNDLFTAINLIEGKYS